jgi:hypothetical protein
MKADAINASGTFVGNRLPDSARVLDIGCTTGYPSIYCAKLNPAQRREDGT